MRDVTTVGFCVTDFDPFNSTRYYASRMDPHYESLDSWLISDAGGATVGVVRTIPSEGEWALRRIRRSVADIHRNPVESLLDPLRVTMNAYAFVEGGDYDRVGDTTRPARLLPAGTVRAWCANMNVKLVRSGPEDRYILCDLGDIHRKSLIVAAWGPML